MKIFDTYKIKINDNLKFSLYDLKKIVDARQTFTLRNIFDCIKRSSISLKILKEILNCPYLDEYMEEAYTKKAKSKKISIHRLEIGYYMQIYNKETNESWEFYGLDKKSPNDKKSRGKITERYALDFTPLYNIIDLPINISNKMTIYNFNETDEKIPVYSDFHPLLTLKKLLDIILHELTFNGSIENRKKLIKMLNKRLKDFKKQRKGKK